MPVTVNSVPRAAPASVSSPCAIACRSPIGSIGMRASVASNTGPSSFSAYTLVRAAAARPPSSITSAGSVSRKPSEIRISVFGPSMLRRPMSSSRRPTIV
ncbi:MAG: hypothetical protein DMG00_12285 [Acidobacteria bacterium]|nr:MAG: hypothetical protein DMG00_12285 [Acidobacteriota bacterium]